jgi:hypothetical protein
MIGGTATRFYDWWNHSVVLKIFRVGIAIIDGTTPWFYDWWNHTVVLIIFRVGIAIIGGTAPRFYRVKFRMKQLKIIQE